MKKEIILFFLTLLIVEFSFSQGDGPRSHLLAPTGVWAINPKYLNLDQNLLPAGNILVENADLNINLFPTTVVHTFSLFGQFTRVFAMANPGSLKATTTITPLNTSEEIKASGFSDGFVAFEMGIIGAPALNALEFSKHQPKFSLMGYFRYWYSGSYNSNDLINLGTNRSTFEFGTTMAIPFHKDLQQNATWLEIMPTVQFFTANNNPARSSSTNKVRQEALFSIENHLTHNFTKKLWAGIDLRYQIGGTTKVDGMSDNNQINILGGGANVGYQIMAPLSIYGGYDTIIYGDNNAKSNMIRVSLVFVYINLKKLKPKKDSGS